MRKNLIPTFLQYSFNGLVALGIVYLVSQYHIEKIPGFSLAEGFMIAGELIVACAFILALRDTKLSPFEEFMEGITSQHDLDEFCAECHEPEILGVPGEIPEWLKPQKKTTKGIPLSEEHKRKISESLKKRNAEKKAQAERIAKTATASAKRKASRK